MSKPIVIKFDNSLPDKEIHGVLLPTSVEEGGNTDTDMSQVKIVGSVVPLVKFNNRLIPWQDIRRFTLTSTEFLPTLYISFIDRANISVNLDTPGPDNEVIVEIMAPFDNIYKKIKLTFYIRDIHINTSRAEVSADCIYYIPGLNSHSLKAYGQKTSYEMVETLAKELKLGMCSNMDETNDPVWRYSDNRSPLEVLTDTIRSAGSPKVPVDGWVDWWNNVNLVDVRDAYDGPTDDDLKVWVMGAWINVDPKSQEIPSQIPAEITNDYRLKLSPLYTSNYTLVSSNRKNRSNGTDRVLTSWDMWRELPGSTLIEDGSGVKENVFTTYVYTGEYDGETSDGGYLIQREVNEMYKQKISNGMIRVCLQQPCLGLMRGHRVNVKWYETSDLTNDIYDSNAGMKTNIPIDPDDDVNPDDMSSIGSQRVNMKISGQYYIVGATIDYLRTSTGVGSQSTMVQFLTLARNMKSYNYSDATKDNNI